MKYIEKLLQGAEVEWRKLGEVCSIKTGKAVSKQAISENIGTQKMILLELQQEARGLAL